jgi:hypothetical protein
MQVPQFACLFLALVLARDVLVADDGSRGPAYTG